MNLIPCFAITRITANVTNFVTVVRASECGGLQWLDTIGGWVHFKFFAILAGWSMFITFKYSGK